MSAQRMVAGEVREKGGEGGGAFRNWLCLVLNLINSCHEQLLLLPLLQFSNSSFSIMATPPSTPHNHHLFCDEMLVRGRICGRVPTLKRQLNKKKRFFLSKIALQNDVFLVSSIMLLKLKKKK